MYDILSRLSMSDTSQVAYTLWGIHTIKWLLFLAVIVVPLEWDASMLWVEKELREENIAKIVI